MSIDYILNEIKQTWTSTVQEILGRDDLKTILKGLLEISEAVGKLIKNIGLLGTAITAVSAVKWFKNDTGKWKCTLQSLKMPGVY